MKQALFICKRRPCGTYAEVAYGLINSAQFVAAELECLGFKAEVVTVQDANDIDRVVVRKNPDVVFIEALWVPPQKLGEILSLPRHRGRKWVIRNHSKIPFLAGEGIAIEWLQGYRDLGFHNLHISSNSIRGNNDLEIVGIPSVLLPNVYNPPVPSACPLGDSEWVHVGCFGSIRPLKNQLLQAVAAIRYAEREHRRLAFHVNGDRVERGGESAQKNLRALFRGSRHKLIEHDWMPHGHFIHLVTKMDAGLCVSYSETFCIVAADFVKAGVPVVGSEDIDWLPEHFVANPNDSEDVSDTLGRAILADKIPVLRNSARRALDRHNRVALDLWRDFLR